MEPPPSALASAAKPRPTRLPGTLYRWHGSSGPARRGLFDKRASVSDLPLAVTWINFLKEALSDDMELVTSPRVRFTRGERARTLSPASIATEGTEGRARAPYSLRCQALRMAQRAFCVVLCIGTFFIISEIKGIVYRDSHRTEHFSRTEETSRIKPRGSFVYHGFFKV